MVVAPCHICKRIRTCNGRMHDHNTISHGKSPGAKCSDVQLPKNQATEIPFGNIPARIEMFHFVPN